MRDHIRTTVAGAGEDLRLVIAASERGDDPEGVAGGVIDLADRLADERRWLAAQPLSALLEDRTRVTLTRYRILVVRAELLLEHYLMTMDPDEIPGWTTAVGAIAEVMADLDSIPDA